MTCQTCAKTVVVPLDHHGMEMCDACVAEAHALAREQAETIRNDSWPGGIHGQ